MSNYPSKRNNAPEFDVAAESRAFTAWIDAPDSQKELRAVLPDNVTPEVFIRTAKQAVLSSPSLLNPKWRASLMQAIAKAAAQGLPPDGKHGALVPRQQKEGGYGVSWQPMVWGIIKLGRQVKSVGKVKASLVFYDEPFRFISGDEDRIEHEEVPEIRNAAYGAMMEQYEDDRGETAYRLNVNRFMERVQGAYCIIKPCDGGDATKRFMPRTRIDKVRAVSSAAGGPWSGPFADEMILKTVILYTMKWVDTSNDSPEMRRFREALETDTEVDFDKPAIEGKAEPASRPALPAPEERMNGLEDALLKATGLDEKVSVAAHGEPEQAPEPPKQAEPANDKPSAAPTQDKQAEREAVETPKKRMFADWLSEVDPKFAAADTLEGIANGEKALADTVAKLNDNQRSRYNEMVSSHRARVKRRSDEIKTELLAELEKCADGAALNALMNNAAVKARLGKMVKEDQEEIGAVISSMLGRFHKAAA